MSLFQKSVLKKHLKGLDEKQVNEAWERFKNHFHNPFVQENIRASKEESHQGEFLIDLFVKVLGYTNHPHPNYNLVREQKNVKDSKTADGAIIKDGKIIAVIELKGTNTTDLGKIEAQAFGYKNNQPDAVYVITSNFEKLRFYIDNAVDFEDFNLFQLTKDEFQLLWLCLSKETIFQGTPKQIKSESLAVEETVTNKLYKDYSAFRNDIFTDIVKNNPQHDKLTLFNKTQKLLDRFLFIFFAEDKGLLPPNSVSEILNLWDKLKELDEYQPLYNRFKKYFGYLNNGYKGKQYEIFAYNGGLFAPDDVLDTLIITDNLLYNHCRVLHGYDYDTEVDTNILGHIFEHSLNEVDEIAANLEGGNLDKGKTKRKKDGIFYTPRYITKYIVENTIGTLCEQKKEVMGLDSDSLVKVDTKKHRKIYQEKINDYRKWLLGLTICDPACGSGAFLNQALEFLIKEHRLIDEMTAMLFGDAMILSDNVVEILENNIFGVDINEESVEIARLSLWLRTAKVGRKLNDLSRNIKCGNSLISDPAVAGDLAFDWQKAFPQVFAKGGFDIIIGNPPYVRVQNLDYQTIDWLKVNKQTAFKRIDISTLFIEEAFSLLNQNGRICYITSNQFFKAEYGRKVRGFIKNLLLSNLDLSNVSIFDGASTYVSILIFSKQVQFSFEYSLMKDLNFDFIKWKNLSFNNFTEESWEFGVDISFKEKIYGTSKPLGDIADFTYGIITGLDKAFILSDEDILSNNIEKELVYRFLKPENYKRYSLKKLDKWIIYPYSKDNKVFSEEYFAEKFPNGFKYLSLYKTELANRQDSRTTIAEKGIAWFAIMRKMPVSTINSSKIVFYDVGNLPNFYFENHGFAFGGGTSHSLTSNSDKVKDLYLLSLLNSRLITWLIYDICPVKMGDARKYGLDYMKKIPIKVISVELQQPFISRVEQIIQFNTEFQSLNTRFLKLLQSSFSNLTANKKIETWYEMTFGEFRKELKKQKIDIPIKELMDYQELFDTNAALLKEIQTKINNAEKEIDKLVYELYELTNEEVQIIENQFLA